MDSNMSFVIVGIRIVIGVILLIAGMAKIFMNGSRFFRVVRAYKLLPVWIAELLARWLPWLEIAIGSLLIFGVWTKFVTVVAMFFFVTFTAAVTVSLLRGKNINCGCFGQGDEKIGWRLVIRNTTLLTLSALVFIQHGNTVTVDAWLRQRFGDSSWMLNLLQLAVALMIVGPVVLTGTILRSKREAFNERE